MKKDKLLKRDIYSLVESITPYLPFLGILSGGITTARHVYNYKMKAKKQNNYLRTISIYLTISIRLSKLPETRFTFFSS